MGQTKLQSTERNEMETAATDCHAFASLSFFDDAERVQRAKIAARLLSVPIGNYEQKLAKKVSLIAEDFYFYLCDQRPALDRAEALAVVALAGYFFQNQQGFKAKHAFFAFESDLTRLVASEPAYRLLHAKFLAREGRMAKAQAQLAPLIDATTPNPEALDLGLLYLRLRLQYAEIADLAVRFTDNDSCRWHEVILAFQKGGPAAAIPAAIRKELFEITSERKLKAWLYIVAAGDIAVSKLMQSPQNVKRHHVRLKSSSPDLLLLTDAASLVESLREGQERDPYLSYEKMRLNLAECTDPEVELLFYAGVAAVCQISLPSISEVARATYERQMLIIAHEASPGARATVRYQSAIAGDLSRQASLLGSAAKVASVVLADRLRYVFTLGHSHRSSRDEVLAACTEVIAKDLAKYRGGLQKLVQLGAGLEAIVPDSVRIILKQTSVNQFPISPDETRRLLAEGLGQSIEEAFQAFEEHPVACGSIAQVHKAVGLNGVELAVKIKIPKIEAMMASDFKGLRRLSWFLSGVLPITRAQLSDVFKAWADFTAAECDFDLERRNLALVADLFKQDPHIKVPQLAAGMQSSGVLVTSFAIGLNFDEFLASSTPKSRQTAGLALMRFVVRSLRHGFLKYDLDPSNFKFSEQGICVLDYGGLVPFEWDGPHNLLHAIRSMQLGDASRLKTYLMGVALNLETYDVMKDLEINQELLLKPFLMNEAFRFTTEYARRVFFAMTADHPNRGNVTITRWWMPYTRFYWTVFSLLGRLEVEANWYQIVVEECEMQKNP